MKMPTIKYLIALLNLPRLLLHIIFFINIMMYVRKMYVLA